MSEIRIPVYDPRPEIEALWDEIHEAMDRVLRSGTFILGPEVEAFEEEVAEYLGVKHAIGVASGTDALWLSLKALDVGPGDYVLTTPFTFFATASAILNTGALPVFADIDPKTFNIDPAKVEEALAGKNPVWQRLGIDPKRVKVLLPVHLYGQPADMDELMDIASRYGLRVVEDTAQAMGAEYKGRKAGTIGDLGAFSFFPTKNLGAFGDGGLVATDDDRLAEKVRMLRAHGSRKKYYHELIGTNSRLDALQAAMLRVKLPHLDRWIQERRRIAHRYTEALRGVNGLIPPYEAPGRVHTYHQYTVRVLRDRRENLKDFLETQAVGSVVYYPLPVYLQPALKNLGYQLGDFPEAERAYSEVLSLPMFPGLTTQLLQLVIRLISDFLIVADDKTKLISHPKIS